MIKCLRNKEKIDYILIGIAIGVMIGFMLGLYSEAFLQQI
jgi:hypothetical protein